MSPYQRGWLETSCYKLLLSFLSYLLAVSTRGSQRCHIPAAESLASCCRNGLRGSRWTPKYSNGCATWKNCAQAFKMQVLSNKLQQQKPPTDLHLPKQKKETGSCLVVVNSKTYKNYPWTRTAAAWWTQREGSWLQGRQRTPKEMMGSFSRMGTFFLG